LVVAKKKTSQADMQLDESGRVIEQVEDELANDRSVLIVEPTTESFGVRPRAGKAGVEATNGQASATKA